MVVCKYPHYQDLSQQREAVLIQELVFNSSLTQREAVLIQELVFNSSLTQRAAYESSLMVIR